MFSLRSMALSLFLSLLSKVGTSNPVSCQVEAQFVNHLFNTLATVTIFAITFVHQMAASFSVESSCVNVSEGGA